MKTFQCISCGFQIQRAVTPLSCPACGQQRVGLFREVGAVAATPQPGVPQQPAAPVASQTPPMPASSVLAPPPPPPGMGVPGMPQPPTAAPVLAQPVPQPAAPPAPAQPQAAGRTKPPPKKPPPREAPQPAEPAPKKRRPAERAAPSPPVELPEKKTPVKVPVPKAPRRRSAAPQAVEAPVEKTDVRPSVPKPQQFAFMFPEEGAGAGPHAGVRGRTIVDDEGRIFACVGGRLVAIKSEGEELSVDWIYSTDSHIPGDPALGPDGNIRVHAGDGSLHCVTRGGRQAWAPLAVGEPLGWSSPVVDAKGNTWICSYLGGLKKIDDEGHTSDRPYFRTRQKFDSTGVIHQGVFYVGGEDGFIYAIELSSGRRGRNVWDHDKGAGKTDWFINSQLLIAGDGTLVVASRDDCLYGFQPGGELAWKTEMPGQILASPVLDARGDIYLGLNCVARGTADQGRLVCVRGNSHKIAWQHSAAGAIESTPVVGDDGVVYVGDNAGVVHALGEGGAEQWQAQLAAPVRSAGAIIAPGRVAFGLDDDTLVVLKCSSKAPSTEG